MASRGTASENKLHSVLTLAQAAAVLGVIPKSVHEAARRRAENGMHVCWERGAPGNPMGVVLVDHQWVLNRAADGRGVQAEVQPSVVSLPPLPGLAPSNGLPGATADAELASRLTELESLLDSTRREADQERFVRLEGEVERYKSEAESLRGALASFVNTPA
jgi:hypothetical protein